MLTLFKGNQVCNYLIVSIKVTALLISVSSTTECTVYYISVKVHKTGIILNQIGNVGLFLTRHNWLEIKEFVVPTLIRYVDTTFII